MSENLKMAKDFGVLKNGLDSEREVRIQADVHGEKHLSEGIIMLRGTKVPGIRKGVLNRERKMVAAEEGKMPVHCRAVEDDHVRKEEEDNLLNPNVKVRPSEYFQVYSKHVARAEDVPIKRGVSCPELGFQTNDDNLSMGHGEAADSDAGSRESCKSTRWDGGELRDPEGASTKGRGRTGCDDHELHVSRRGIQRVRGSTSRDGEYPPDPGGGLTRGLDSTRWDCEKPPDTGGIKKRHNSTSLEGEKSCHSGESCKKSRVGTNRGCIELFGAGGLQRSCCGDTIKGCGEQFDPGGKGSIPKSSCSNTNSDQMEPFDPGGDFHGEPFDPCGGFRRDCIRGDQVQKPREEASSKQRFD